MTVVAREGNLRTERLTARATHYCGTQSAACTGPIRPGEVYLKHTAYPGHDALGLDCKAPQSMAECAACARLYGRQAEIEPPPLSTQLTDVWIARDVAGDRRPVLPGHERAVQVQVPAAVAARWRDACDAWDLVQAEMLDATRTPTQPAAAGGQGAGAGS